MSMTMNIWKIEGNSLSEIKKTELAKEERLENWLANDISILGLDLLIIGRQVVTDFGGRIDLLGITEDGMLQIIELKKDKTPRDIVAQVLDYASWVKDLTFSQIDNISRKYLGKDISNAFIENFNYSIPEKVNDSHGMIIVASELDDSSERIVQYLSNEYKLNINCIYFNYFIDDGKEYLGRSWLMDPGDVIERNESSLKSPWTGYWFYNVGEGPHRNWDDYKKYGYISAGQGEAYSRPLRKLKVNDKIFAYMKGLGYVAYGVVTKEAVPIDKFQVDEYPGKRLYELDVKVPNMKENHENEIKSEWIVGVNWQKYYSREDAKRFTGIFANQNIVCKLRDNATLDFLLKEFDVKD